MLHKSISYVCIFTYFILLYFTLNQMIEKKKKRSDIFIEEK